MKRLISISVMIPLAFFCIALAIPHNAQSEHLGGVYSLGNFFSNYILAREDVAGLSLRAGWNVIEPQKGVFNWSSLDSTISKASTSGKIVMIRVWAGKYTPDWIYEEGVEPVEFVNGDETITMPVPWDRTYLRYWKRFIKQLGKRYANNKVVVMIHMTGPCKTGEMHLPEKHNEPLWLALGYTGKKIERAWRRVIDWYAEAFPETRLTLSIATPVAFGDSTETLEDILAYASSRLGARLSIQGNWLSPQTNEEYVLYQMIKDSSHYINVGFQMLYASKQPKFGGTLREAIDKGLRAGASYLEIYNGDTNNPELQEDLEYADVNLKLNEK